MCHEFWALDAEQLRVVDDKNDSRSHELKVTNALDSLGLWIIWKILGRELRALVAMNN